MHLWQRMPHGMRLEMCAVTSIRAAPSQRALALGLGLPQSTVLKEAVSLERIHFPEGSIPSLRASNNLIELNGLFSNSAFNNGSRYY